MENNITDINSKSKIGLTLETGTLKTARLIGRLTLGMRVRRILLQRFLKKFPLCFRNLFD